MTDLVDIGVKADSTPITKLTAELDRAEKGYKKLDAALNSGKITAQQYAAGIQQVDGTLEGLKAQIDANARAAERFGYRMQESQKGARRFELGVQQAGYQVGDFFVQVQSGTNWMVAFGQQATQLAGFFAGPWGAAFGAGIAITTALGAAFMRTGGEAANGAKQVDAYSKAVSELTSEIQKNQEIFLKAKFDTDVLGIATAKQQIEELRAAIPILTKEIEAARQASGAIAASGGFFGFGKDEKKVQLELLTTKLSYLEAQQKELDLQKDVSEYVDISRQAFADSVVESDSVRGIMYDIESLSQTTGDYLSDWAGNLWNAYNAAMGVRSALDVYNQKAVWGKGMMGRGQPATGEPTFGGPGLSPLAPLSGRAAEPPDRPDVDSEIFGPDKKRGGRRGPSASSIENKLKELYEYLNATKQVNKYLVEEEEIAFKQRESLLKSALDKKLITLQEYQGMEKDLSRRHQEELKKIESSRHDLQLKDTSTFFEGLAAVAQAGGDRVAKVARVFSAAQALTNSYLAFTQVLADPSLVGRPWARFGLAASALASGLQAVAAIKSGSGGSISGVGSVGTSSGAAQTTPQQVMLQGLRPDDLFSGQFISDLFDKVYKENGARGTVFMVAK